MRRFAWGFVACLLTGCAGNAVSGSVAGNSMAVHDAVAASDGLGASLVAIHLSTAGNLCANLQAGEKTSNSSDLTVYVAHGPGGVFRNGQYNIVKVSHLQDVADLLTQSDSLGSAAQFTHLTSDCTNTLTSGVSWATSGTVTITHVDLKPGGDIEGSFDLLVGSQQDHLTGSFAAAYCDISNAPSSTNVCQ